MHISDQIADLLIAQGWEACKGEFVKTLEAFAQPGLISNGRRVVRLAFSPDYRWLERRSGWGDVDQEIDLRNYPNAAQAAIDAALL